MVQYGAFRSAGHQSVHNDNITTWSLLQFA